MMLRLERAQKNGGGDGRSDIGDGEVRGKARVIE
jgi:hypothetical protein